MCVSNVYAFAFPSQVALKYIAFRTLKNVHAINTTSKHSIDSYRFQPMFEFVCAHINSRMLLNIHFHQYPCNQLYIWCTVVLERANDLQWNCVSYNTVQLRTTRKQIEDKYQKACIYISVYKVIADDGGWWMVVLVLQFFSKSCFSHWIELKWITSIHFIQYCILE